MREHEEQSYATNWVSKNDLYLSRPDLHAQIENLNDGDMEAIAKDIGDALAQIHNAAIDDMLATYLGAPLEGSDRENVATEEAIFQPTPEPTQPRMEYNGWGGKGDTIASARYTYLTFLWLTNDQTVDAAASDIISRQDDRREAVLALKEFVEKKLFTNDPSQDHFADDLARDIFQHEVNWLEIVKQYLD